MTGETSKASEGQPSKRGPSPARWAAAGVIGGASVVGMLWSIIGRAPAPLPSVTQTASRYVPQAMVDPAITVPRAEREAGDQRSEPGWAEDRPPSVAREAREPIVPVVTRPTEPEPRAPEPSARDVLTERLDINRASKDELELLPNIGPTLAERIITFRDDEGPIRSLTHLTDVRGIGVRTAEAIEPYIRFE